MMDFLEWCFHHETPFWVGFTMIIISILFAMLTAIVTIVMIAKGYWIVMALWLIVPLYFVIAEYLKHNREQPGPTRQLTHRDLTGKQ